MPAIPVWNDTIDIGSNLKDQRMWQSSIKGQLSADLGHREAYVGDIWLNAPLRKPNYIILSTSEIDVTTPRVSALFIGVNCFSSVHKLLDRSITFIYVLGFSTCQTFSLSYFIILKTSNNIN